MSDQQRIQEQLERSSLGTPAAKAARRTIPTSYAERVVAMAERRRRNVDKSRSRKIGGNDLDGTYTVGVIVESDGD